MSATEKRKPISSSSSAQSASKKSTSIAPKKPSENTKGMSGNNNAGNQPLAGGKPAGKPAAAAAGGGKPIQQSDERRVAKKRPLEELIEEPEQEEPEQQDEEDAMDIDGQGEEQEEFAEAPAPPLNKNRFPPPKRSAPTEDGGGKSARVEKKASPSAYKLTNDDLKMQLTAGREALDELTSILGITTEEQREAFIQATLREKLQEAAAEQRAIQASLHQLAADAGVDAETLKSFDAAASDMVNGKGLDAANGREMGKFLAAVAGRFGNSSAMSHPLLEADYQQRKKQRAAAPDQEDGDYEEPRERTLEGKAGLSFGSFGFGGGGGNGKTLDLNSSPWGSKFFNQSFSSRAISNAGLAVKKGANSNTNAFRSQGQQRQGKPRAPQIPEGYVMPSGRRNARVSSNEDGMEIDNDLARQEDDEENEPHRRINELIQDHGFKYKGKQNVKQFVNSLPKDINGYTPGAFDFENLVGKITPNGWNHHLLTAIMYPDYQRLGTNPSAREIFTEQSSFYNRADPPRGYLPRLIHGNKPLIVAEEDKE
jgi:hypothetical protein